MKPEPVILTLTIRPLYGGFQAPPWRRLARLVKAMKRGYGWQLLNITPAKPASFGNQSAIKVHPKRAQSAGKPPRATAKPSESDGDPGRQ